MFDQHTTLTATFKNNIFYSVGAFAVEVNSPNLTSDFNLFFRATGDLAEYQSAAQADLPAYRTASGLETNSIQGDPLFVDAANNDFALSAGSPAIGAGEAGVNIGAIAPRDTVTLTGTLSDGATEAEIVSGGETLILTLTGDTWVAAGMPFDDQRQAIINGITSAASETLGWNNEVRDKEVVGAVVRDSDTQATITFTAAGSYNITSNENVIATVPAAALVTSSVDIVAVPGSIVVTVSGSALAMSFTGLVTSIEDSASFLPVAINLGDPVTGSFCYTTTATDRESSAEFGDYRFHASPDTLTFTVEDNTWQPASRFTLQSLTRNGASGDTITVSLRGIDFPTGLDSPDNPNHSFMQFSLKDTTGTVLSDDSLPTGLTLANWDLGIIEVLAVHDLATGDYYRIIVENVQTLVEP